MFNWSLNAFMTTNTGVKQLIDETDENNVYIWTIRRKDSILDTNKPIWQIQKITKTWSITATYLDVNGTSSFANIWDNRASYVYF